MISTLDLPSDRFEDDSLADIKNKNFIFGKMVRGRPQSLINYMNNMQDNMM